MAVKVDGLDLAYIFGENLEADILERYMQPKYVSNDNLRSILENVIDRLVIKLPDEELDNLSFTDYITGIYTPIYKDFMDPTLLVESYKWLGRDITENDCRELLMMRSPFISYEPIIKALKDKYKLCKEQQ